MPIGGHHGDGFRLQHHQCSIQRVARFFTGDGESSLGNHAAQHLRRNLDDTRSWESREAGEIRLRHSYHFGIGTATANADPVILQQFDGDVRVRQELYVVVQLAGGDGARAFFLHFNAARSSQA